MWILGLTHLSWVKLLEIMQPEATQSSLTAAHWGKLEPWPNTLGLVPLSVHGPLRLGLCRSWWQDTKAAGILPCGLLPCYLPCHFQLPKLLPPGLIHHKESPLKGLLLPYQTQAYPRYTFCISIMSDEVLEQLFVQTALGGK